MVSGWRREPLNASEGMKPISPERLPAQPDVICEAAHENDKDTDNFLIR
jgi:hypothetical protein